MSHGNRGRAAAARRRPDPSCPHGMPTVGGCVLCMDDGNLPEPPRVKREGWPFTAQRTGPCGSDQCHAAIDPGDKIVRMSDGGYRHIDCERNHT